jgi:hypothetical protein
MMHMAMLRIWWSARERQRFYTYTGSRQHPKRPRVWIGSAKRRMEMDRRSPAPVKRYDGPPSAVAMIRANIRQFNINWQ